MTFVASASSAFVFPHFWATTLSSERLPQIEIISSDSQADTPLPSDIMAEAQVDLTTIPISPDGGNAPAAATSDSKVEDITVFHDKENFTVKHPLMHRWTLWFTKPASGKVR